MSDFTSNWIWAQWAYIALTFLTLLVHGARHGKDMLEVAGEDKGKPQKYNAFVQFLKAFVIIFILIAGGFFK